jgi:hypothetical protein
MAGLNIAVRLAASPVSEKTDRSLSVRKKINASERSKKLRAA